MVTSTNDYEKKSATEKVNLHADTAKTVLSGASDMFYAMAQENKKWFKFYQATAIAEALIAGAQAIMMVYKSLPTWAAVPVSVIVGGLMATRIAMIARQKPPEYKAKGGVMGVDAMSGGGVTSGMAQYIVGDNPSGKELVVPSEGIHKDSVQGAYVRDKEESGAPTIINVFTEEQFADVMSKDLPKNTMINHMVQDSRERGASFKETRRVSSGGG